MIVERDMDSRGQLCESEDSRYLVWPGRPFSLSPSYYIELV